MSCLSIDIAIGALNGIGDLYCNDADVLKVADSRGSDSIYNLRRNFSRMGIRELVCGSLLAEDILGDSMIEDEYGGMPEDLYGPADADFIDGQISCGNLSEQNGAAVLIATRSFKNVQRIPPVIAKELWIPIHFYSLTGRQYLGRFDLELVFNNGRKKYLYLDLERYSDRSFRAKQQLVWQMGVQHGLDPSEIWCLNIFRPDVFFAHEQIDIDLLKQVDMIAQKIVLASQIDSMERSA